MKKFWNIVVRKEKKKNENNQTRFTKGNFM